MSGHPAGPTSDVVCYPRASGRRQTALRVHSTRLSVCKASTFLDAVLPDLRLSCYHCLMHSTLVHTRANPFVLLALTERYVRWGMLLAAKKLLGFSAGSFFFILHYSCGIPRGCPFSAEAFCYRHLFEILFVSDSRKGYSVFKELIWCGEGANIC